MASFDKSGSQILRELADSPARDSPDGNKRKRRSLLLSEEDFAAFKSRLATYKIAYWAFKPDSVSALTCARYGWVCMEKDLLQCCGCKVYLSGHLPCAAELNFYFTCAKRLEKSLIDAHTTSCEWRSAPTPISEISPNVSDAEVALVELKNRLQSFKTLSSDSLMILRSKNLQQLEIPQDDVNYLTKTTDSNPISLALTICGWKAGSCSELLCCDYCLRELGLWQFVRPDSIKGRSVVASFDTSSPKRLKTDKIRELDPVAQHHSWCPWRTGVDSLSAVHSNILEAENERQLECEVPRWKALVRILTRSHDLGNFSRENVKGPHDYFAMAKQLMSESVANNTTIDPELSENSSIEPEKPVTIEEANSSQSNLLRIDEVQNTSFAESSIRSEESRKNDSMESQETVTAQNTSQESLLGYFQDIEKEAAASSKDMEVKSSDSAQEAKSIDTTSEVKSSVSAQEVKSSASTENQGAPPEHLSLVEHFVDIKKEAATSSKEEAIEDPVVTKSESFVKGEEDSLQNNEVSVDDAEAPSIPQEENEVSMEEKSEGSSSEVIQDQEITTEANTSSDLVTVNQGEVSENEAEQVQEKHLTDEECEIVTSNAENVVGSSEEDLNNSIPSSSSSNNAVLESAESGVNFSFNLEQRSESSEPPPPEDPTTTVKDDEEDGSGDWKKKLGLFGNSK